MSRSHKIPCYSITITFNLKQLQGTKNTCKHFSCDFLKVRRSPDSFNKENIYPPPPTACVYTAGESIFILFSSTAPLSLALISYLVPLLIRKHDESIRKLSFLSPVGLFWCVCGGGVFMTRCCADKLSTDGVVVSKKTGTTHTHTHICRSMK